jgi:NhaA family Na+:H+ antiporter
MAISRFFQCRLDPIDQVLMPFQAFFKSKSTSGVLLMASALAALVWANSPWAASYDGLWSMRFTVGLGDAALSKPLLLWVNDGLMALFFFVVGLEIKREFLAGELSSRSQAILPIAAAVGGMAVPALFYILACGDGGAVRGWGIPMATDIAFALGIMALLGDRVPYQLKIFLTAVAIVDDIGAVLVIALFYTADISMGMLGAAGVLLLLAMAGNRLGIRTPVFYALIGCVVWLAVLKSGVHSTVAGVLMAFTIPARSKCDSGMFIDQATAVIDDYMDASGTGDSVLTNSGMNSALLSMQTLAGRAQTPLQRLEYGLHPLVDYAIMPIFALANAGVALSAGSMTGQGGVVAGTVLGLVLGKPVGILIAVMLIAWVSGGLPGGLTLRHFVGAGLLCGIGFTMSLFIAALAFADSPALLTGAKVAILGASAIAGASGYLVLRGAAGPKA